MMLYFFLLFVECSLFGFRLETGHQAVGDGGPNPDSCHQIDGVFESEYGMIFVV
jgi:hypothetical protein